MIKSKGDLTYRYENFGGIVDLNLAQLLNYPSSSSCFISNYSSFSFSFSFSYLIVSSSSFLFYCCNILLSTNYSYSKAWHAGQKSYEDLSREYAYHRCIVCLSEVILTSHLSLQVSPPVTSNTVQHVLLAVLWPPLRLLAGIASAPLLIVYGLIFILSHYFAPRKYSKFSSFLFFLWLASNCVDFKVREYSFALR